MQRQVNSRKSLPRLRFSVQLIVLCLVGGLLGVGCVSQPWPQADRGRPLNRSYPPSETNQRKYHPLPPQAVPQQNPESLTSSRLSQNLPGSHEFALQGPQVSFFKAITESVWRTRIPARDLYPLLQRTVSQSYIIRHQDPRSLSIQTEWDKFFIGGRLFRNRMSLNLFQVGPGLIELVVNNKVEYFRDAGHDASGQENSWIPTQDITNEKQKLIENLNTSLNALRLQLIN